MSTPSEARAAGTGAFALRLPSGQVISLSRQVTVGSAADNDVVLADAGVAPYHAALVPRDEALFLFGREDAGGARVNGGQPVTGWYGLQKGDRIQVGSQELLIQWLAPSTPAMEAGRTQPHQTVQIPLPPTVAAAALYLRRGPGAPRTLDWDRTAPFVIGRTEGCALVVPDPSVSRRHAEVSEKDGTVSVADLGSANGTLVNGTSLTAPGTLVPGDAIAVGPVEVVYEPPAYEPGTAVLVRRDGAHAGSEVGLERINTTIGSAADCDIVLPDPSLAPRQAWIRRFFADFWLFASSEAETVSVNNQPVDAPRLLRTGDTLRVGDSRFSFRQQEPRAARAPVRAAAVTLRDVAPFSELDEPAFSALVAAGSERTFPPGSAILRPEEGKKSKHPMLCVVLAGKAEVRGPIGGNWETPATIATLRPGDFCGERTLVLRQPYPYEVHAVGTVRAFCLTDKELDRAKRAASALEGLFRDRAARAGLVKYLREIPLFARVPADPLNELAKKVRVRKFPAGDVLARAGEPCRTLFIVAKGSCRVNITEGSKVTTLTHLTEGKYVGEQVAGTDENYPYTVIAETAVEAYAISRDDYQKLAADLPESLDFGAAGVPPSVILQRTAPFNVLPPELNAQVALSLRAKDFRAGETVIFQDDPISSAFYVIVSGKVDVRFRTREGEERSINQLRAGECFGEAALITGAPRNASVVALEDCHLLALYRREFDEILERSGGRLTAFLGQTFTMRSRPKHIDNFEVYQQHTRPNEAPSYMLKNGDRNSYMSVSEDGMFLWNMLDGEHTMADLVAAYFQKAKVLSPQAMFQSIAQWQALGFLDVQPEELIKRLNPGFRLPLFARALMLFSKITGFKKEFEHADAWFRALYRAFGSIFFMGPVVALLALVNVVGVGAFVAELVRGSPHLQFELGGVGVPLLFVVFAVLVITHEMAHGVAMIHIGRKVLSAGVGLMLLMPRAYVNITDSWMSSRRGRGIAIASGPVLTLTTASAAALALPFTSDGTLRMLLTDVAVFGYLLFILNANPLFESDGYNFVMNLIAIPKLRPRSLYYLLFGGFLRGMRGKQFSREQRIFLIFGSLTVLWTGVMASEIGLVVHQFASRPLGAVLPDPVAAVVQTVFELLLSGLFVVAMVFEARVRGRTAG